MKEKELNAAIASFGGWVSSPFLSHLSQCRHTKGDSLYIPLLTHRGIGMSHLLLISSATAATEGGSA
jgi:hypothetical protein